MFKNVLNKDLRNDNKESKIPFFLFSYTVYTYTYTQIQYIHVSVPNQSNIDSSQIVKHSPIFKGLQIDRPMDKYLYKYR